MEIPLLNATTKIQPRDELFVIGSPQDIATAFAHLYQKDALAKQG